MNILDFIDKSPTCFHTVDNVKKILSDAGYERLEEGYTWKLKEGGKYFVTRNGSSLIAFSIPSVTFNGFMIGAAHGESPSYKVKINPQVADGNYVKLAVEPYGGMMAESWMDRPLSVAGRVVVRDGDGLQSKLVNIDRDLLIIPSVALHLKNKKNEKTNLNPAVDMLPLFANDEEGVDFLSVIAQEVGVKKGEMLAFDLFLYNRMKAMRWGQNNCFLSAPRLDDLSCVYSVLAGFINAKENKNSVPVFAVFDNEEVGSCTKQGASSTFLSDVLHRINWAFGDEEDYIRRVSNSFFVSADNGHAVHPNHAEMSDKNHAPVLNGGVVIKHNAAQHYCTDAVSDSVFRLICKEAGVPYQLYFNRADIKGGSTLGNLSSMQVSLNSVDVGIAQLSMHSSFETLGSRDIERLCSVMSIFFGKAFSEENDCFSL